MIEFSDVESNEDNILHENIKIEIISSAWVDKFPCFLRRMMIIVGFRENEALVSNPKFHQCMFLVLNNEKLKYNSLNVAVSSFLSSDERNSVENILASIKISAPDPRTRQCIELFNLNFPALLKDQTKDFKHDIEESEDNLYFYKFSFSSLFIQLWKNLCKIFDECQKGCISHHWLKPLNLETSEMLGLRPSLMSKTIVSNSISFMTLIAQNENHSIFCVSTIKDNFALKVLRKPTEINLKKFRNELEICQSVAHHSFRKSVERVTYNGQSALLLEWSFGAPLSLIKRVKLPEFFVLAREVVSALQQMHRSGYIHTNLTSKHVIYDCNQTVKIIGSRNAVRFRERYLCSNTTLHGKDLRYISPEQSNHFNRSLDFRSDFYSLGIIFYKLLSGIYPFEDDDALNIIRKHVFSKAKPLTMIDSKIPVSLSNMILKLLNKNAGDRYNSAKGILHDLDLISVYSTDPELSSFELAQHDNPETLLLDQKLFCREVEFEKLKNAYDIVARKGFELVCVTGVAGIGKSRLSAELSKLVLKSGVYGSGNFDKVQAPYSALLEAISNICNYILLQNQVLVSSCRTKLSESLGQEASLVTDLIGNLKLIIGEQKTISEEYGEIAKNRFHFVLLKLIKVISSIISPVVMVLEDFHLVDTESIGLLSALIFERDISNVLVVLTYRENEINLNHPASSFLQTALQSKLNLTQIALEPFHEEKVNEIISYIFKVSPFESYSLTALVHKKVQGNPFFLLEMLTDLFENGSIYYCEQNLKWKWDSLSLDDSLSANVLEMLRKRMLSLGSAIQKVLIVASLLGCPFSILALKRAIDSDADVREAICTGMIKRTGDGDNYHFVHENVQLAAFSFIPQNSLKKSLFCYGKKLLKSFSGSELYDHIFTVAYLLSFGINFIEDQKQSLVVAEIYLVAGSKALRSTAFKKANDFFKNGIALLEKTNCWEVNFDLSHSLYTRSIESAYCTGDEELISLLLDSMSEHVKGSLLLTQSKHMQIRFYNDRQRYPVSIELGITFLNSLGLEFSVEDDNTTIDEEILEAKMNLEDKAVDVILQMKNMEDDKALAAMLIMNAFANCCYVSKPKLFAFLTARMVKLTFKYGISMYSAPGFSGLALSICHQDYQSSLKFATLSLKFLENTSSKKVLPLVYITCFSVIFVYHSSIHSSLDPLMESYRISRENGDKSASILCAMNFTMKELLCGIHLNDILEHIEELNDDLSIKSPAFLAFNQFILNLLDEENQDDKIDDPSFLVGEKFDFHQFIRQVKHPFIIPRVLIYCVMLAYMFHNLELAQESLDRCRSSYKAYDSHFPWFVFYDGLVSIAVARKEGNKSDSITIAKRCLEKLKELSVAASENFSNKYYLLKAELDSFMNLTSQAISNYEKSISLSKLFNLPHEEALACERLGLFYLDNKIFLKASQNLEKSYHEYLNWGAKRKANVLLSSNRNLLKNIDDHSPTFILETNMQHQSQASTSALSQEAFFLTVNSKRGQKRRIE